MNILDLAVNLTDVHPLCTLKDRSIDVWMSILEQINFNTTRCNLQYQVIHLWVNLDYNRKQLVGAYGNGMDKGGNSYYEYFKNMHPDFIPFSNCFHL